jgi:ParB family transcriptional regulator, chromosome partitioning protein
MERKTERRGLGRGLSALMADVAPPATADAEDRSAARRPDQFVPVEMVYPNPDQPRRSFTAEALEDLAASIRARGVLQPLIVRPGAQSGTFELVAGERRWRAAQIAQLHEVPVIIRDFDDSEVLEVAIIENIQRADLNPIEEAAAFRQLMDKFGHTQERLAEALSKSRSYIANLLRLLNLPPEVQNMLREGVLSAGHARALITSENPLALAQSVVSRGLSVRETEKLAKESAANPARAGRAPSGQPRGEKDADTRALESDLSANLGMSVTISHEPGGEKGALTIRYNSLDDLDLLCRVLSMVPRDLAR